MVVPSFAENKIKQKTSIWHIQKVDKRLCCYMEMIFFLALLHTKKTPLLICFRSVSWEPGWLVAGGEELVRVCSFRLSLVSC